MLYADRKFCTYFLTVLIYRLKILLKKTLQIILKESPKIQRTLDTSKIPDIAIRYYKTQDTLEIKILEIKLSDIRRRFLFFLWIFSNLGDYITL